MDKNVNQRVVAIVQARMGSTRLPGKVLKKVVGKPILEIELERIKQAKSIDRLVVATTKDLQDNAIEELCQRLDVALYRGSHEDVLDRYYEAAQKFEADVVVRLTADCPLIDPAIIDEVVTFFLKNSAKYDYVSNTNVPTPTFPRGMDVEVFSFSALEQAAKSAEKPEEREHVTPFIFHHRELFDIGEVFYKANESHRRWTVDTPEDLELITKILEALYPINPNFALEDVLNVLKQNPQWEKINAHVKQKALGG